MHKLFFKVMLTSLSLWLCAGCSKVLTEEPKSLLVPSFFSTSQGLQQGLYAAYGGMRNFWGSQDLFTMTDIGTDDFTRGVDGNSDINLYTSNYTPTTGVLKSVWKNAYTFINTCNGVIDNADKTDLPADQKARIKAEAKFLRANYYFILVQFYGDLTINEHFQATATTAAVRSSVDSVYALIIKDLKEAIVDLPAAPTSTGVMPGQATAIAAQHILAKVYLTRGYSKAKKSDDFQNALTMAKTVIENSKGLGLGLLPDFGDVFKEGNEANAEVLWSVQHTANIAYNGPNNSGTKNFSADNVMNHMFVPQYEKQPGMIRSKDYGRPYIRCVPTHWLTDTVFAERQKDSRYNKTFQTVWYGNDPNPKDYPVWPSPLPAGAPAGAVSGQPKFAFGDTAIYMPGYDVSDAQIKASKYLLIPPRKYANNLSPAMFKYFDTQRAGLNDPSIRPTIAFRLAETYLLAAEAAFQLGQPQVAADYINKVRERAAAAGTAVQDMDITSSQVNIDFILDERARELCGEMTRWWDLVRTGKLLERVRLHNPDAGPNIQPKHILRPIPQDQIDATTTGTPYPQNPGWQ
ncbi:MAG TPA: RagB/SusD family nutrient uptake outer membrane protein [Arachidicoccus sp.]|nr:RagB/SusD family nutrient uptake outer membrane protein [Arachidicoccus sp.]